MLTGQIKRLEDIPSTSPRCGSRVNKIDVPPAGDLRRHTPRFEEDVRVTSHSDKYVSDSLLHQNLRHNFAIVDTLTELAKKKNITPAQLSIAWVSSLGSHVIPLPGSSYEQVSAACPLTFLIVHSPGMPSVPLRILQVVMLCSLRPNCGRSIRPSRTLT